MANTKKTTTKKKTTNKSTTTKKPVKKVTSKTIKKEPKVEVKEEFTEEELRKDFFDSKDDNESAFLKVMNIILWIVLFIWIALCIIDFVKTKRKEEPLFTFNHEIIKYEDGEVESYLGLGYKIYHYNRKCINGYEYGPFWSKDKSINEENCSK